MSSSIFNFIENLLGRVLFASFYTLVTIPWLNFAFQGAAGVNSKEKLGWFALAVILGGIILQLSERIKRDLWVRLFILGVIPAAAYLLSKLAFARIGDATDYTALSILSLAAMLLYLMLGFRYQKTINGQIEFMSEFSLLAGVMLVNLIINSRMGFAIGYQEVLYFFITGIALGTYRKFKDIHTSAAKSTRSWFYVTLAVIGFVSLFAAILTFGFSKEATQLLLAPLIAVLVGLREMVILLMEYAMFMLAPVLDFIFSRLKLPTPDGQPREGNEIFQYYQSKLAGFGTEQPTEAGSSWLLWGLVMVVVGIILIIVVVRLRRHRDSEQGYEEVRESILTAAEVKADFLTMLQALTRRVKRREALPSIYDGSTNALQIREIYHRFISRLHKRVPFLRFYTPKDYLSKVQDIIPPAPGAELTQIYEQARYSRRDVSAAEVARMEQAYGQATESTESGKS